MTIRATVLIEEDAAVVLSDGLLLAVRQHGVVEVWSESGETHMGNLPVNASEADIRRAAGFWSSGFMAGVSFGRDEAQAKLRRALGINT